MADECVLVIHGGERWVIRGDYQDVAGWFSHKASSREARQFQLVDEAGWLTVSSAQIVAVIGKRE